MKNYLLTLLFASICTGIVTFLASSSKYEKQVRYLCLLLTLLALISPLPTLFSSFGQGVFPEISLPEDLRSQYGQRLKEETLKRLNETVTAELQRKCSLGEEDFSLSFEMSLSDDGVFSLDRAFVTLHSAKAILKREKIHGILQEICSDVQFKESLK